MTNTCWTCFYAEFSPEAGGNKCSLDDTPVHVSAVCDSWSRFIAGDRKPPEPSAHEKAELLRTKTTTYQLSYPRSYPRRP